MDALLDRQIAKLLISKAQGSEWPDPADWIEENYWIPETRGPIVLLPYQRDALREALSRDENGLFKYSTVVWSDCKKSAKSSIAAAVAMYFAMHAEWGEIYIIANDLKQADSRVAMYFRRAFELNPAMNKVYRQRGYRMTIIENNAIVEAIPIDPSGEAGSNADFICFSELWGAHEEAKELMWGEMTLSPTKQGKSMRWVETYAGFMEESLLLYNLYERGVNSGEMLWPNRPYDTNFEGPQPLELFREGRMLCLWNTKPRCPWQDAPYYAEEEKLLSPSQFQRVHRNQWVSSEETFIPIEWWDACYDENMPDPDGKTPMVIALDAAVDNDTFGNVMVYRHPTEPEDICVRFARKWEPPSHGKLDFMGTDENPGPEKELYRLLSVYNVIMVTYDPYQLEDMMGRLRRQRLTWVFPFNQGSRRLIADSMLRDKIRDRRIHHKGEPHLREHLMNANAKLDDREDRKIRIVKRVQQKKIDLAVALSMAVHENIRLNLA